MIKKIRSLKYQRCTPHGCTEIGIRKFQFMTQTSFIWKDGLSSAILIRLGFQGQRVVNRVLTFLNGGIRLQFFKKSVRDLNR